jgi:xylulokinase
VSAPTVLTLDLGTSATKATLWADGTVVGPARAPLTTLHPGPGRAEQDPSSWWTSVVDACATLRGQDPDAYAAIDVVACSAARETFALFDATLAPLGPGILWSDHRAHDEVVTLGDPVEFRRATGVMPTAGCAAAKVAWVARHDPAAFAAARWLLAPRDLVVARLTGSVTTDPSLASRTGWYALDGSVVADAALRRLLPEVAPATDARPAAPSAWSDALRLGSHVRVVPGEGDRACEARGAGASTTVPMVSWGTTANVSVPHPGPPADLPVVAQVSWAGKGFLVEAGLAAAGSAMDWLAAIAARPVDRLWSELVEVPPGARGVLAVPWFAGARAPHWRPGATASFSGLRPDHTTADLARAVVEGVALDVARSIDLLACDGQELVVTGGGAANPAWRAILAAVTDRTVVIRRHVEAASVGARLLAANAVGDAVDLDAINPVTGRETPDPAVTRSYASIRAESDALVARLLPASEPEEGPR